MIFTCDHPSDRLCANPKRVAARVARLPLHQARRAQWAPLVRLVRRAVARQA